MVNVRRSTKETDSTHEATDSTNTNEAHIWFLLNSGSVPLRFLRCFVLKSVTSVSSVSSVAHSHRNTFAEIAVQTSNISVRTATSPACASHPSPCQIPFRSETA